MAKWNSVSRFCPLGLCTSCEPRCSCCTVSCLVNCKPAWVAEGACWPVAAPSKLAEGCEGRPAGLNSAQSKVELGHRACKDLSERIRGTYTVVAAASLPGCVNQQLGRVHPAPNLHCTSGMRLATLPLRTRLRNAVLACPVACRVCMLEYRGQISVRSNCQPTAIPASFLISCPPWVWS